MLTLILAAALNQSQEKLTLTDAEILKMGRDKFSTYYTDHIGYSTLDMCDAQSKYGEVIKKRNDGMLKTQPASIKTLVVKVRPILTKLESNAIDVSYAISGGGTMWNPVYAGVYADVEEVVYDLMQNHSPKARKVSEVRTSIQGMKAALAKAKKEMDGIVTPEMFKDAGKSWDTVLRLSNQTVDIASKQSRQRSDALLDFIVNTGQMYKM